MSADPIHHLVTVNGIKLSYYQWGSAKPGQPTLLMLHATGYHARLWDNIIERIGDHHVIAVDLRGHGQSEKIAIDNWRVLGEDVQSLLEQLDLHDVIGIGHSLGAHILVVAAAACASRFRRLVLIDPTILAPSYYALRPPALALGEDSHPAAKRRDEFASVDEMIAHFKNRAPFSNFHPDVVRDYCQYGLRPNEQGDGFKLACPPKIEASVYECGVSNPGVHACASRLKMPVLIVRAKEPSNREELRDFSFSPTWPGLVNEIEKAREVFFPDKSHYLPMEHPDEISHLIREQIALV